MAKTGRMASSASAWGTSGNLSIKPGGFFAKRLASQQQKTERSSANGALSQRKK